MNRNAFCQNERSDTWATDQIPNMQQIWVLKQLATHPKALSKVIICQKKKKKKHFQCLLALNIGKLDGRLRLCILKRLYCFGIFLIILKLMNFLSLV